MATGTLTSKLIAILLAATIIGGATITIIDWQSRPNENKGWKPQQVSASSFPPSVSIGERSMANQAFGSFMESMGISTYPNMDLQFYQEPTLTIEDVLEITNSHPKINEFIAEHPDYMNFTYYDGSRWYVDYYDTNGDWAYVIVRDADATIIQIYVVQGNEVFLDWPTAELNADQVLTVVDQNQIVQDYFEKTNTSLLSAWVWFDGNNTWYVSYSFYFVFAETNIRSGMPIEAEFGFTDPSSETSTVEQERMIAPDFNPYWMEIQVSDSDSEIIEIISNFEESAYLTKAMDQVLEYAKTLEEYRSFENGHDFFYSWITIKWVPTNTEFEARWVIDTYAWETKILDGFERFEQAQYWTSSFLSLSIRDSDFSLSDTFSSSEPIITPEEVFSSILGNQTIQDFIERYESVVGYLSYDPFYEYWTVSIYPSWTWGAYFYGTLNSDLDFTNVDIQNIPDDQMPTKSLSEILTIVANNSDYQDFVQTYVEYGEIHENIYYNYYEENKSWTVYAWSQVIGEAYLIMEIDDTSGLIMETFRQDPINLPIHNTSEILELVEQLPEVQEFLNSTSNPIIWISYYSNYGEVNSTGIWYVTFSSSDYSRQLSIQINDATLEIIRIYQYP